MLGEWLGYCFGVVGYDWGFGGVWLGDGLEVAGVWLGYGWGMVWMRLGYHLDMVTWGLDIIRVWVGWGLEVVWILLGYDLDTVGKWLGYGWGMTWIRLGCGLDMGVLGWFWGCGVGKWLILSGFVVLYGNTDFYDCCDWRGFPMHKLAQTATGCLPCLWQLWF